VTRVCFADLNRQFTRCQDNVERAITRVVRSQRFIGGPELKSFEERFAALLETEHAIGVSSGTDALVASLMALDIGTGDEVITPPFGFFASAEAIVRVGARPVFVDIDPDDFLLDNSRVEAAITERTRAILVVHLFGQMTEMSGLTDIARRHDLEVIEDAAQAVLAKRGGQFAATVGTTGCFSFFPAKNLGAFGDGGMVVTADDRVAEELQMIRRHGTKDGQTFDRIGGNFRLDAIQAAILGAKLEYLPQWTQERRAHAAIYDQALADLEAIQLPVRRAEDAHVYHQYVIRTPDRDCLKQHLAERGVESRIYYPYAMHEHAALAHLGYTPESFPEARRAAREVLALPVFSELRDDEQAQVIEGVRSFCRA
jgi:dTDP-4-amino-4,6-dideoxygalactose transaminase